MAVVLTLVSPVAGLGIVVGVGPVHGGADEFRGHHPGPLPARRIGRRRGRSAVIRTRPLPRPSFPLALALVVIVGTLLGVLHTLLGVGTQDGIAALEGWLVGIGGAALVLLSAAYVAWSGEFCARR